jgi:hypothetical protein
MIIQPRYNSLSISHYKKMFQTTNQSWYLCSVHPEFPNFGIQRLSAQVDHLIDAAIRRFVQQKNMVILVIKW